MQIDRIGWDIGGAHLKAAGLANGVVVAVAQRPCPLWRGLDHLHAAAASIVEELAPAAGCRHVLTMTGELVDLFEHREQGVLGLLAAMREHCPVEQLSVFAGPQGFLPAAEVDARHVAAIASANWLATGLYAAGRIASGLLVDIGSTTTDILVLHGGTVSYRGYSDFERMRYDELVYTGAVRTSLMALTPHAPFRGEWVRLMAEHFATTADVYRLLGDLPAHADQADTADGGPKTPEASARRLARMLGLDAESVAMADWVRLARYFRERQLSCVGDACARSESLGLLAEDAPLVGAGVGRFLVQELARRSGRPYLDFDDVLASSLSPAGFHAADCAPAVAVACLAEQNR
ncbi:hydantoinase/oxoprolinase family protein [Methylococcus sp. EFPC2]|uniref:hydantoinase/oxoprolinase family protein n=1 Tax=Methylococcus sp. EFPC2 TaxID=2812648 RepID=UPI0019682A1A|nr:hydantoinase/oxoprolinase family protein [Methylococcus sp. EFPC2]QSA96738.1 H4MPT-linked C1 transfer pathway protein [Methylococcus sp. EFPC2]